MEEEVQVFVPFKELFLPYLSYLLPLFLRAVVLKWGYTYPCGYVEVLQGVREIYKNIYLKKAVSLIIIIKT